MAYIWKVATIGGTHLFSTSMIMGGSYCGMVDGETPIIGQPESLKGVGGRPEFQTSRDVGSGADGSG